MKQFHRIIGSAGHIDHGKTTLIKALTGVDCDRLKEEKKRGITIDIGFASLPLPDGGVAGIVDVPGHRKFVHNMLAGAAGIDVALLVVAADDAVMPQTVEHLAILEIIGVTRGMVAVTKADMVDAETLKMAVDDVAALIAKSSLAGANIIPCSPITGAGMDEVKSELFRLASIPSRRDTESFFRMPIDRAFTMKGHGLVITGSVFSGSAKEEDRVVISPGGMEARIRKIQSYGRQAEVAAAGARAALNITGPQKEEVHRGMVACHPSIAAGHTSFFGSILCHPLSPANIVHGKSYLLHLHTAETLCEVALDPVKILKLGGRGFAKIRFGHPVNLLHGDRFVIRSSSANQTLGGGMALLPGGALTAAGSSVGAVRELLAALEKGVDAALAAMVRRAPCGYPANELMAIFNMPRQRLDAAIAKIGGAGIFEWKGEPYVFLAAEAKAAMEKLAAAVAKFHADNPAVSGMDETKLAAMAHAFIDPALAGHWIRKGAEGGLLEINGALIRIPGRRAVFSGADEKARTAIVRTFRDGGLNPPKAADVPTVSKIPRAEAVKIVRALIQDGELVTVAPEYVIHRETLQSAKAKLLEEVAREGFVETARYRDILGCGRKTAIDLLEYFDGAGLTRRVDNKGRRVLV
ncbi:MAG: selenocysteine-specific translation elongation factor [Nitrospinae bacterium]|nr:selenocysteine-specific translation elongation factor [Nitrospinota bacterium]